MSITKASLPIPEAAAVVGGFDLQREADRDGRSEFGDRIHNQLVDVFGDLEREGVVGAGAAFAVIVLELLHRLALLSGEPRDDLWRDVVATVTDREMRNREGEIE